MWWWWLACNEPLEPQVPAAPPPEETLPPEIDPSVALLAAYGAPADGVQAHLTLLETDLPLTVTAEPDGIHLRGVGFEGVAWAEHGRLVGLLRTPTAALRLRTLPGPTLTFTPASATLRDERALQEALGRGCVRPTELSFVITAGSDSWEFLAQRRPDERFRRAAPEVPWLMDEERFTGGIQVSSVRTQPASALDKCAVDFFASNRGADVSSAGPVVSWAALCPEDRLTPAALWALLEQPAAVTCAVPSGDEPCTLARGALRDGDQCVPILAMPPGGGRWRERGPVSAGWDATWAPGGWVLSRAGEELLLPDSVLPRQSLVAPTAVIADAAGRPGWVLGSAGAEGLYWTLAIGEHLPPPLPLARLDGDVLAPLTWSVALPLRDTEVQLTVRWSPDGALSATLPDGPVPATSSWTADATAVVVDFGGILSLELQGLAGPSVRISKVSAPVLPADLADLRRALAGHPCAAPALPVSLERGGEVVPMSWAVGNRLTVGDKAFHVWGQSFIGDGVRSGVQLVLRPPDGSGESTLTVEGQARAGDPQAGEAWWWAVAGREGTTCAWNGAPCSLRRGGTPPACP